MQLGSLSTLAGEFLQGSYRGVPFVVMGNGGQAGRKQAVHDYPYRDTPWVEDLGRKGRLYRITGFLCGATCYVQRDLLADAAESKGPGLLVHPTIGIIRAASCRSSGGSGMASRALLISSLSCWSSAICSHPLLKPLWMLRWQHQPLPCRLLQPLIFG